MQRWVSLAGSINKDDGFIDKGRVPAPLPRTGRAVIYNVKSAV